MAQVSIKVFWVLLTFICAEEDLGVNKDLTCTPIISDSSPYEDEFRQIDCGISTCSNVYKIIYKKTSMYTTEPWTPVFAGINKTHYKALATGENYTLEHRIEYTAFPSKHMLYIMPFIKQDQGKWKCIVYADGNLIYQSETLDVDIYVTPAKNKLNVIQSNTALVTDQEAEFTCIVNGIHPEASVVWEVNGVEQIAGMEANELTDGLWILNNTLNLEFSEAKVNVLSCVITTRSRDPWLRSNITIDVKEKARVSDPTEDIYITAMKNTSFTLDCIGSGFKPYMSWTRDGTHIETTNDSYTIKRICNDNTCIGSITALAEDLECFQNSKAVYTCVISLHPPYQSIQASPLMIVNMPHKACTEEKVDNYLAIVMFLSIVIILLCLILMVLVVVFVLKKCQIKRTKDLKNLAREESVYLYNNKGMNDTNTN